MSDCPNCAKLQAEIVALKKKLASAEAHAVPPVRGPGTYDARFTRADIAARTLPPPKPKGFQG